METDNRGPRRYRRWPPRVRRYRSDPERDGRERGDRPAPDNGDRDAEPGDTHRDTT